MGNLLVELNLKANFMKSLISMIECYHCFDSFFTQFNNSYNTIGGASSNPMKVATTNVTNRV